MVGDSYGSKVSIADSVLGDEVLVLVHILRLDGSVESYTRLECSSTSGSYVRRLRPSAFRRTFDEMEPRFHARQS